MPVVTGTNIAPLSGSLWKTETHSVCHSHAGSSAACHLCLTLNTISTGETLDVIRDVALVAQKLDVCTIDQNTALLLQLDIFVPSQWCETPVFAHNDLLSARELVHRSSQSLDSGGPMTVERAD